MSSLRRTRGLVGPRGRSGGGRRASRRRWSRETPAVRAPAGRRPPRCRPFTGCAELRQWYVDAALPQVGPWGFGSVHPLAAVDRASEGGAVADSGVSNSDTGTNVQEAGVDEPDVAKTDGRLLVRVGGAGPAGHDVTGDRAAAARRGSGCPGRAAGARELLLVDDTVLVVACRRRPLARPADRRRPDHSGPGLVGRPHPAGRGRRLRPARPVGSPATSSVDGTLVAAREYGDGTVRAVVGTGLPQLDFVTPTPHRSPQEATRANRAVVARRVSTTGCRGSRGDGGAPPAAARLHRGPAPRTGTRASARSACSPSRSAPRARPRPPPPSRPPATWSTPRRTGSTSPPWTPAGGALCRSPPGWRRAACRARTAGARLRPHRRGHDVRRVSGACRGTVARPLVVQRARGPAAGRHRLWDAGGPRGRTPCTCSRRTASGSASWVPWPGLGPDESIQSVRWLGDLAVVVTFRQTDPLYTLDLSDPADPRVLGELKIRGFSAYLHPRRRRPAARARPRRRPAQGATSARRPSVFDLSDLGDVRRSARHRVSALGASSAPARTRARSPTCPSERLALVPVERWRPAAGPAGRAARRRRPATLVARRLLAARAVGGRDRTGTAARRRAGSRSSTGHRAGRRRRLIVAAYRESHVPQHPHPAQLRAAGDA